MPTFFRVVQSDPPTLADFNSDEARGLSKPVPAELARMWDGLSVMDSEERARRLARRFGLGNFIAAVRVEEGGPIRYERTLHRRGHHTLWGDPAAMLERVQSVVPV
jgi:hypothetical protein